MAKESGVKKVDVSIQVVEDNVFRITVPDDFDINAPQVLNRIGAIKPMTLEEVVCIRRSSFIDAQEV